MFFHEKLITSISDSNVVAGRRQTLLYVFLVWMASMLFLMFTMYILNPVKFIRSWASREWIDKAKEHSRNEFGSKGVTHLINSIFIKSGPSPVNSGVCRLPIAVPDPNGRVSIECWAIPDSAWLLSDEIWIDNTRGRFLRIFRHGTTPILALAYDGMQLYRYNAFSGNDEQSIQVASCSKQPKNLTDMFGLTAGLPDSCFGSERHPLVYASEEYSTYRNPIRVFKTTGTRTESKAESAWYWKLRKNDQTLVEIEYQEQDTVVFTITRMRTETQTRPPACWDLTAIIKQ